MVGLEDIQTVDPETIEDINEKQRRAEIKRNISKHLWSKQCGLSTAQSRDDFDARKEVLRSKYGSYFKSFEHHTETIWNSQVVPGIKSEFKCGYNVKK